MPFTKKVVASEDVEGVSIEAPAVVVKPKTCGHINRHYINADGLREDLKCTLPIGHADEHSAPYNCLRLADGSIAQARAIAAGAPVLKLSGRQVGRDFVKNEYIEVAETAYWSDGASILIENVQPDLAQLERIKKTKGDMLDASQLARKLA